MIGWKEYYKKAISDKPSYILKDFFDKGFDKQINEKNAIDLGCGCGNDMVYLLKNNYSVIGVDKEQMVVELIKSRITEKEKVDFIINDFSKIELPKTNLIVSNFSIPFCQPVFFEKFCKEFTNSINLGGYFCRKLFWTRRWMEK